MSAIKVLVIDKDSLVSRKLMEFLGANGFDCRLADTLAQAREIIVEWPPDLALVELAMPDGTGVDFVQWVKTHPALAKKGVRIAIMSAHSQVANVRMAIQGGATDYIVKPIPLETIVQRFAFLIQEKKDVAAFQQQAANLSGADYYLRAVPVCC